MEYALIALLLLLSALFSGLTLGFLGLDKSEIERKKRLGNHKAQAIYEIRKNGNLLLVTLLLGNVLVNAILSVLLASLASGIVAVAASTFLIVIFGEILPQAFFAKYALDFGYFFVPFIRVLLKVFYPITFPVAWALEKMMGEEEETIWDKNELAELIKDHEDHHLSDIDQDEEKVLLGALSFSEKTAGQVMTKKNKCYTLSENTDLNERLLEEIKEHGFSRIPVYHNETHQILGTLYVKDLISLNASRSLKEMYRPNSILQVRATDPLDTILNRFINKRIHMAYVTNNEDELTGILTLEDIVEEIINTEIEDETDH